MDTSKTVHQSVSASDKAIEASRVKVRGANGKHIAMMMGSKAKVGKKVRDYVVLLDSGKVMTHETILEVDLVAEFERDWLENNNPPMLLHRSDTWRIVGKNTMKDLFWRSGRAVSLARIKV